MTRLTFGVDRDPGSIAGARTNDGTFRTNPCVAAYGPGPEGKRCGDCAHLIAHRFAKTYYKCDLRVQTASAASDHRVRWPACARFASAEGVKP